MIIIFLLIIITILLYAITYIYSKVNKKPEIFYKDNIYVKKSDIGGIGVFANKDFNLGDVIEISPYIEDVNENYKGITVNYIFQKTSEPTKSVIAFGYASLYNHSDDPSVQWRVYDGYMIFIAVKSIKKDEEMLISYGPKYWTTPERMAIKK